MTSSPKTKGSRAVLMCIVVSAPLLGGCSSVGFGFKTHPTDCAIGVPWADCLPGTPGYANGGGEIHRKENETAQQRVITNQIAAVTAQCKSSYLIPELDTIRGKVELFRDTFDGPPPFEIAVNDTFPNEVEYIAIAKWAMLREECDKRFDAVSTIPPTATPLQVAFLQRDRAFSKEAGARVGDLIVALYQQRLTYGEFAKKRYEITRDAAAAERQFREATLLADQGRQVQAQQMAQQMFQNNLATWSAYMQSVNARQPQTVHVDGSVRVQTNCNSQRLGNMVSTNCY